MGGRTHTLDAPLIDGVVVAIGLRVWFLRSGLGGSGIMESVVGLGVAKPRQESHRFPHLWAGRNGVFP